MGVLPDILNVQQHKIRACHQLPEFTEKRFPARKRLGRGVQAGMDAALLCFAEQLQEEIHLHQRLASAGRDAALVSPVAAVALRPVEQLVRRILRAFLQLPGIRIVAEPAAHPAAGEKNKKPYARPVHRTKAFQRMNIAHAVLPSSRSAQCHAAQQHPRAFPSFSCTLLHSGSVPKAGTGYFPSCIQAVFHRPAPDASPPAFRRCFTSRRRMLPLLLPGSVPKAGTGYFRSFTDFRGRYARSRQAAAPW